MFLYKLLTVLDPEFMLCFSLVSVMYLLWVIFRTRAKFQITRSVFFYSWVCMVSEPRGCSLFKPVSDGQKLRTVNMKRLGAKTAEPRTANQQSLIYKNILNNQPIFNVGFEK